MGNSAGKTAAIGIIVGIALYNIGSLFTDSQGFLMFCGIGGFFYFFYLFYDAKTPEAIDRAFAKIGMHVSYVIAMVSYGMLINWIVGLLDVQPENKAFAYLAVFVIVSLIVAFIEVKVITSKKK